MTQVRLIVPQEALIAAVTQSMSLIHDAASWESAKDETKEDIVSMVNTVAATSVMHANPYIRAAELESIAKDHPEIADELLNKAFDYRKLAEEQVNHADENEK